MSTEAQTTVGNITLNGTTELFVFGALWHSFVTLAVLNGALMQPAAANVQKDVGAKSATAGGLRTGRILIGVAVLVSLPVFTGAVISIVTG